VEVQVYDTGAGLAPEVLERLFQPFMTTKAEGMGVGLSICRTIIEAHGGEISARNRPEGGAVFRFTLRSADLQPPGEIDA
jgi:two-component system sensor kinase FixL